MNTITQPTGSIKPVRPSNPQGIPKRENTRRKGTIGEKVAQKYLKNNGYAILGTNWNKQVGEIDIICSINGCTIFVEVKTGLIPGLDPSENFTKMKQSRFLKTGLIWAKIHNLCEEDFRYDCIFIQKRPTRWRVFHYKNIDFSGK